MAKLNQILMGLALLLCAAPLAAQLSPIKRMKMKRSNQLDTLIMLGVSFLIANSLLSQNDCFEQLQDASGFPTSQFQIDLLETASCRLIDSLPSIYQDSFKVYDFGFYLHNEVMQGGIPQVFTQVKNTVSQQSKYYLLFGKQSDKNGVYTRFWVDLNLPNGDVFYCIDQLSPTLRNELTQKFELIANTIHQSNNRSPYSYHVAEQGVIDSLFNYISDLKKCCIGQQRGQRAVSECSPCAFSKSQFEALLINEGLLDMKVKSIVDESQETTGAEEVGFKIEINDEMIDLDEAIDSLKAQIHASFPSVSIKVYPFNYGQQCSNFSGLKNQFLTEDVDLGILIGVIGNNDGSGTVYWQMASKKAKVPEPVPFTSNVCYYFNSASIFVRTATCNTGPRGIIENMNGQGFDYEFTFADPETTPLTLTTESVLDEFGNVAYYQNTSEPLLNTVMIMSKPMIWERLALGTSFEPKAFAPWSLYKGSSGFSAPFDYSTKDFFLDRINYLFITDIRTDNDEFLVVGHNFRNMGNFLWGASTYIMGVPEWLALLGAHINNLNTDGGWDSPDDQYSIKLGRYYAERVGWKTVYAGRRNIFRK